MKLNMDKPLTIGAKRTLKALQTVMEELLEKKSFDQIQTKELCEKSMIPRATFYNYFEDKYDLLQYVFTVTDLRPAFFDGEAVPQDYMRIIDRFFDNAEEQQAHLARILRRNPPGSTFVRLYEEYFRAEVCRYIYESGVYDGYDIPQELMAQVTSDVILDVYEWVYIRGHETPREEIDKYIKKMLIQ